MRSLLLLSPSSSPPPPPTPNYAQSDLVVILAALLCALICVVGLALVARCSHRPHSSSPPPPPNKGVSKKLLRSLPVLPFDPSALPDLHDCAICLALFQDADQIRVLPHCAHAFHAACVDAWLRSHCTCPSCRRILVAPAKSDGRKVGVGPEAKAVGGGGRSESSFLP